MQTFLTETEQDTIRQAIVEQEERTAAEFVTVVADASDTYLYIPVLIAALLSMMLTGIAYIAGTWTDFVSLYTFQVLLFLGLALCFRLPFIKPHLIPATVKRKRAARMARRQFFEQGMHNTSDRLGVMLFVSQAEHYVEILADTGASALITDVQWYQVVRAFGKQVGAGKVAAGFLQAVTQCGEMLAEVAPPNDAPANELPNHLVMINSADEEDN